MAGSVNKHIIIGSLGKDPEKKTFQDGNSIVNMSVATSESWTDKQSGERREATTWHSVVIKNNALAEVAAKYLKKGSRVYLEGRIEVRKWQDQSGNDRYSTETVIPAFGGQIVLLDGRDKGDGDSAPSNGAKQRNDEGAQRGGGQNKAKSSGGNNQKSFESDLDDEIPF